MTTLRRLPFLLAALILAPLSFAQAVDKAPDSGMWVAAVLAILLVGIVVIGSFMSPRRGHQD